MPHCWKYYNFVLAINVCFNQSYKCTLPMFLRLYSVHLHIYQQCDYISYCHYRITPWKCSKMSVFKDLWCMFCMVNSDIGSTRRGQNSHHICSMVNFLCYFKEVNMQYTYCCFAGRFVLTIRGKIRNAHDVHHLNFIFTNVVSDVQKCLLYNYNFNK